MHDGMNHSGAMLDAAWIAAFESEATAATLLKVHRYAIRRGRGVARVGGRSDAVYAEELVQDALSDTLAGIVRWEPSKLRLATHLIAVIRSRSRHERDRTVRFCHEAVSLSLALDTDTTSEQDRILVAQQALSALRAAASGDREVLKILDAYAAGAVEKAEVLQATGLKSVRYTRARKRLRRKTQQLAPELRAAARAA